MALDLKDPGYQLSALFRSQKKGRAVSDKVVSKGHYEKITSKQ